MKTYAEKRLSLTFYTEDLAALRRLNLSLRDLGADVEQTDTMRLLLFSTSEAEMFSYASLRYHAESKGMIKKTKTVETRFSVVMPKDLKEKIGRVRDDLARKDVIVELTYIVRSLLLAPHDAAFLVGQLPRLEKQYPDKRKLRWQSRE